MKRSLVFSFLSALTAIAAHAQLSLSVGLQAGPNVLVSRSPGGSFWVEKRWVWFEGPGDTQAPQVTVTLRDAEGQARASFPASEHDFLWPSGGGLILAVSNEGLAMGDDTWCVKPYKILNLQGEKVGELDPVYQQVPHPEFSQDGKFVVGWSHSSSEETYCAFASFGPRPKRPQGPRFEKLYLLLYSLPLSGGTGKVYAQDDFASCWQGQSWAEDFVVEPVLAFSGDDFLLQAGDAFGTLVFRWAKGQCLWKLYQPTPWRTEFAVQATDLVDNRLLLVGGSGFVVLDVEKGRILQQVDLRPQLAKLAQLLAPARPGVAQALADLVRQQQEPGGKPAAQRAGRAYELVGPRYVHFLPGQRFLLVGDPINEAAPDAPGWGSWAAVFDGKNMALSGQELLWAAAKAGKISEAVRQNRYASGRKASDGFGFIPEEFFPFATAAGKVFVYDQKGELVQLQ